MENGRLSIISCDSGFEFAKRLEHQINNMLKEKGFLFDFKLTKSKETIFANGEIKTLINESVRGNDVYIVQLVYDPYSKNSINDNIFSLLTAVNAAYNSDADRVTAIIPQFPYARQERKQGREAITARLFSNMLEDAGVDKVITLDIHANAIEGFFNKAKLENLHATNYIIKYLKSLVEFDNLVVVAPDVGSARRCRVFSKKMATDLAIIDKSRNYSLASTIESMRLVGDVKNKNVFINDDLLGTGGTLLNAIELLKEKGALDIYIAVSFAFFNNNSFVKFDEYFKKGYFKAIIGTDAVFWNNEFKKKYEWYHEISVAKLFADVIYRINKKDSVSVLLD